MILITLNFYKNSLFGSHINEPKVHFSKFVSNILLKIVGQTFIEI